MISSRRHELFVFTIRSVLEYEKVEKRTKIKGDCEQKRFIDDRHERIDITRRNTR